MPKKIYIRTFGCQMNNRDTELVYGLLADDGYVKANTLDEADIVLFNTCSVRKHAEDRAWGQAGVLKKLVVPPDSAASGRRIKAGGTPSPTKKIVGLVGCMAQNHKEKIFEKLPHVDFICGPANIYDIPKLIAKVADGKKHIRALSRNQRPDKEQPAFRENTVSAYVSISEGCDNFCSYCIVPYVRGRERSRSKRLILDEVKALADSGRKEVTLLGQNVNSYGRARAPESQSVRDKKNGFAGLLEDVSKIEGIERIRFMTSHPKDATVGLFRAMKDLPKVCEHLHLPLQSGSDIILKKMRRGYVKTKYLRLVEKYRKIVPDSSITTDIIVGFPGETEKDFKDTWNVMKTAQFDDAFIFKYSPRPPAKSARYEDDVPAQIKAARNQELLKLQEGISRKKNLGLVGSSAEVLAEFESNRAGEGRLRGRTRTNKTTVFNGDRKLLGSLVRVKIEKATPHTLIGGKAS